MSLITAVDLAKSYGPDDIFSGISFTIPQGARLAIVGPNGIGKTTLLRILAGVETQSAGQVGRAKNLSMGYLPQEAAFHSEHTLWEECLSAFEALLEMEAELARLEAAMSEPDQAEQVLDRYGRLQDEFDRLGGYTYPTRIRQVLTGLGFEAGEFDYPLSHLSGGQRTRACWRTCCSPTPTC
jgi:ATP-binding cassette, subfamily F, member 3